MSLQRSFVFLVFTIHFAFSTLLFAESQLDQKVADIIQKVLTDAGVPSVSIAIVKDGRIVLNRAYGKARLQPELRARSEMRYKIGSISKQFAATAILLLAEEGKLSLSDPVGKYVPDLTRGNEITIRQILSHTSGYRDYWPQDYVPPFMKQDIKADAILTRWARVPLDFEPGSQYQYSNTGYVMAGVIVETVSGKSYFEFLREKIFNPLGMRSVINADQENLAAGDPLGYTRYGLGPHRIAPKEGKGWLFATGGLAMTAEDLARWNIAMIEKKLLKSTSYKEMQTDVLLTNGVGTRYGLGVGVNKEQDHRVIQHGGAVSGFTALNSIFPDDRAAIAVLTNFDGAFAGDTITRQVLGLLFASDQQVDAAREKVARKLFADLQAGKSDPSLLTENARSYFTEQALRDFSASLAPLKAPQAFSLTSQRDRGGMKLRIYNVQFPNKKLMILMREMPDGKVEQFQVFPAE